MSKENQENLFGDIENLNWWKDHWKDMPEFVNKDIEPYKSIKVHFATKKDMDDFANLISQTITDQTIYIHLPKKTFKPIDYLYIDEEE
jgi:hypothetical protein